MTVRDALARITLIQIPGESPAVVRSAAEAVSAFTGAAIAEAEALDPAARGWHVPDRGTGALHAARRPAGIAHRPAPAP